VVLPNDHHFERDHDMKTILKISSFALAAISLPSSAFAQDSDTASADGTATIIQPITITKDADMAFGTIVQPLAGNGTVDIPNNSDTVTAGAGAIALSGPTSRAKFTIDGEGGQAVTLTVPANFTMTNGTDNLTVTLNPDLGASTTLSGALGSAGSASLNVGGSFTLPFDHSTGDYTGTFNVTAAYQ